MISIAAIWATIGAAFGIFHGVVLWRAVRHPERIGILSGVFRVAAVGTMFVVAALTNGLLPAAMGWAFGLPATSLALLGRSS